MANMIDNHCIKCKCKLFASVVHKTKYVTFADTERIFLILYSCIFRSNYASKIFSLLFILYTLFINCAVVILILDFATKCASKGNYAQLLGFLRCHVTFDLC